MWRFAAPQAIALMSVAAVNLWLCGRGAQPLLLLRGDRALVVVSLVPVISLPAYLVAAAPLAGRARSVQRFATASALSGWSVFACGVPIMGGMYSAGLWVFGVAVCWIYTLPITWISIRLIARPTGGWTAVPASDECKACGHCLGPQPSSVCPECGHCVDGRGTACDPVGSRTSRSAREVPWPRGSRRAV